MLACTHTGIKWHRPLPDGKHAVNVGVIGRPENDGSSNVWYTVLTAGPDLSVEFVPVHYDFETLARQMEQEGLPPEFAETVRTGWWTTCLENLPVQGTLARQVLSGSADGGGRASQRCPQRRAGGECPPARLAASPTPAPRYNLVVIGAGTAGLVTAAGAAGLGARVALVERHLLGGDCLNVGCVPSKCVIRSSRVVGDVRGGRRARRQRARRRRASDFAAVMERMRGLRARISHHDSAAALHDELGVDVFLGDGALQRARHGRGRRHSAPLQEGRHRHRRPRASPAGPGPRRGGLPHQRDRLLADRAAAAPGRHRRRAHRLRAGAGLPAPRLPR